MPEVTREMKRNHEDQKVQAVQNVQDVQLGKARSRRNKENSPVARCHEHHILDSGRHGHPCL